MNEKNTTCWQKFYPEWFDDSGKNLVVTFPDFMPEPSNAEHLIIEWDECNREIIKARDDYSISGYYEAVEIPYKRTEEGLIVTKELTEKKYSLSCIRIDWRIGCGSVDYEAGFYPAVPVIPVTWGYWLYDYFDLPRDRWGYFIHRLLYEYDFSDLTDIETRVNKYLSCEIGKLNHICEWSDCFYKYEGENEY